MAKTWLITGCSEGGLAAAFARTVLEAGDNVTVTARNTDKVRSITKEFPDTALAVTLDVTDHKSVKSAVEITKERFGTIDVLVNNAGYCYRASVEESDEEEVRRMFDTNFFGSSLKGAPMTIPDYKNTAWPRYPENTVNKADQPGDPIRAGKLLVKAVNSEEPPFRLLLGKMVVDFALKEYNDRINELNQWKELSITADFENE